MSVHSATCTNVVNLLYDPERKIDVEWDKGSDTSPYTVRLSLQVEDRKGILADVTSKIAGINTNIRNVEATSDADQRGRIDMTVEISDLKHLQKVVKALAQRRGRRGRRTRQSVKRPTAAAQRSRSSQRSRTLQFFVIFVVFVSFVPQPSAVSERSDDLDFDEAVFRKPRDLNGGACRRGGREVGRVDLVDLAEVVHVGKIDRRRHDAVERRAACLEYFADVLEDLTGLSLDAPLDQVSGGRIERDLTERKRRLPDSLDTARWPLGQKVWRRLAAWRSPRSIPASRT